MNENTMHIGLDDTDSTRKGCTTYIAALLVEKLLKLGAEFVDYPNLIRLNPNVPWKTRGNGALCLRIQHDDNLGDTIKETATETVEENADFECKGTDPGIVFFHGKKVPRAVRLFSRNAITGIVSLNDAVRLIAKFRAAAVGFKKARGIIGSLAAIGETLERDHTFEILVYRTPKNRGIKRRVDEASIFKMDEATKPLTFNNVDSEKHRVIITPRGPDPILLGIRGETPEIVKKAFKMIRLTEPVERWVIFRTNQGTDAHLKRVDQLSEIRTHNPVIARGIAAANPKMICGKHVIFPLKDQTGIVDCAAYEPTGFLRKSAAQLMAGDLVEVYGGVRPASDETRLTINLEKFKLLKPATKLALHNPFCPECGKRLKSMGRDQGLRCENCGLKTSSAVKVEVKVDREIRRGLYITSARSQRHLTKPHSRYGIEKRRGQREGLIDEWHFP